MAADIQVETFDQSFTTDGSTLTLTNDVGSTSSAFVLNLTSRRTSAGPTGSTGNTNWDDFMAAVRLTDTDELTFYRPSAGSGEIRMMGEVWRYTGAGGGEHEFIKRYSGEISISSGNQTAGQSVSGVSDVNKVVCFVTGVEGDLASRNDGNQMIATARMTSSSNVQVERGETGTDLTVHVEVVEFTGSAWSIGFFDSGTIGSDNSATPTLNDQYDYAGSTFSVSDWSTAFIWADMLGDNTGSNHGLEDTWFTVYNASSTTVTIDVDDSSITGQVRGYVIQNDSLSVERETASQTIPEGLDTGLTDPSNITTAGERSIAESYVFTDGTGTAYARGSVTFKLNGATVEAWVHRSGNSGTYNYAGIDLSGLVSAATSASPSISPSPSPGWEGYTRGNYAALPTDDSELENTYSTQEYTDVNTSDNTRVGQSATSEYALHQFKDFTADSSCHLEWEGQSDLAPSSSTVYLQIYNRDTGNWETVDSDSTTAADTDFSLSADIADLTDYKDASNVISCRVYQLET